MKTVLLVAAIALLAFVAAPAAEARPPICETHTAEYGASISCLDGNLNACFFYSPDGSIKACSP